MWHKSLLTPLLCVLLLAAYFIFEYRDSATVSSELAFLETELRELHAPVDGQVQQRFVGEWQHVKAGSPLYQLDRSGADAQLQQLQLASAIEQTAITEQQTALRRLALQIDAQQASVQLASAALTLSERELGRALQLKNAAMLDEQQQQRQAFQRDTQQHALQQHRNELAQLHLQQQELQAALDSHQLRVQQLKSQQLELQRQIGLLQQQAPADGQVSRWLVQAGSFVQAGDLLAEFVANQPRWVLVYLRETDLTKIQLGQRAEVRFDALPAQSLRGRVTAISPLSGRQLARLPPDYTSSYVIRLTQRIPVRLELLDQLPLPPAPGLAASVVFEQDLP